MDISRADLKKNYEDNLNVHFELWYGESDADPYIVPMIEDMKNRSIKIRKAGTGMFISALGSSSAAPLAFSTSLNTMMR